MRIMYSMAEPSSTNNTIDLTTPQRITKEVIDSLVEGKNYSFAPEDSLRNKAAKWIGVNKKPKIIGDYMRAEIVRKKDDRVATNIERDEFGEMISTDPVEQFEIVLYFYNINDPDNERPIIKYDITLTGEGYIEYETVVNKCKANEKCKIKEYGPFDTRQLSLEKYPKHIIEGSVIFNPEYTVETKDQIVETSPQPAKGGKRRTKKASKRSTKKRVQTRVRRTRR